MISTRQVVSSLDLFEMDARGEIFDEMLEVLIICDCEQRFGEKRPRYLTGCW